MNKFSKVIFFTSSYIPLYVFIIILNINLLRFKKGITLLISNLTIMKSIHMILAAIQLKDVIVIALLLLAIVSYILLIISLRVNSGYKEEIIITKVANNNIELLNYVVVYIFAFTTSMFSDLKDISIQKVIVFVLLFTLIGYLSIKSNFVYINPMIFLTFKYNIYKVSTSDTEIIILSKLSQFKLKKLINKTIYPEIICQDVYILK